MRIKTTTLALLTIAAVSLPLGAAHAQTKIGVVNVTRLLQEAPQAQAAVDSSWPVTTAAPEYAGQHPVAL